MEADMKVCCLCPRECKADRVNGQMGFCKMTSELKVARAALHMWEEPFISGEEGSGTVFFSGCPLGCVYCQNYHIAQGQAGKNISIERLAEIFLELQEKKANNINLVTAGHYIPRIIEALQRAKDQGLSIPVVYNSSGYEKVEALRMLEGYVDIYLPDLKYMDETPARLYSSCGNYFEYTKKAIAEMVRQAGTPVFDDRGMLQKGVIVRHLTLPGYLEDSKRIIKYLYDTYGDTIYISILSQYTPLPQVEAYPVINRRITAEEYEKLVDYAIEIGVQNGFIQEGETATESFIPEFNLEGV